MVRAGFVAALVAAVPLALGAASGEGASLDYASSAAGVLAEVHSRGASAVLAELFSDKVVWGDLLGNVEVADGAWLRAAAALRPGAQKGAATELTDAVRLALMVNATEVLSDAVPAFSVTEICSAPEESMSSRSRSLEIVTRQIRAVKGVSGASLAGLRERCLARLEASRKALESGSRGAPASL